MTRSEILNMPAGREIDALVWMVLHKQEPNILMCRSVDGDYQPHAGYPDGHISPPNYSTDISAAWEVIQYFLGSSRKRPHIDRVAEGDWRVQIDDWKEDTAAYSSSAPLAICRSALLVVTDAQ